MGCSKEVVTKQPKLSLAKVTHSVVAVQEWAWPLWIWVELLMVGQEEYSNQKLELLSNSLNYSLRKKTFKHRYNHLQSPHTHYTLSHYYTHAPILTH